MPPLHWSTVLKTQFLKEDQQTSIQHILNTLYNKLRYNTALQNNEEILSSRLQQPIFLIADPFVKRKKLLTQCQHHIPPSKKEDRPPQKSVSYSSPSNGQQICTMLCGKRG